MMQYIIATTREHFSIEADSFDYHPDTASAVFRDETGRTIAALTDVRHVCRKDALTKVSNATTKTVLTEGVGATQYDR